METDTVRSQALWRIWVDTENRVVSFHETGRGEMLEFRDREMFLRCVDEYTSKHFRYQ